MMGASRVELEVDELLSKLQLGEEKRDGVVLAKADREVDGSSKTPDIEGF